MKFGALVLWWRKKIFIILPLFFLFLFISSYSQDDTLKLKQVNIYAKRLLPDAGLIRNDVDSIILTEKANLSLSELLSENTPVFIKSNGRGALATISFRGTAPSQTDVLWNGISIKSPMLGQVDFSLIPVHLIDELSLVHGPALIGDSHGAFGGSVLINNHPDWNNRFSVRAIQGFGSYSTFNEFIQINAGNYYFQSKTRLFYTYSKNNFKFINKNIADIDAETGEYIYPVQRNENADYSQYGLLQELYARPDTHSIASLKLWLQHDYRSIPRLNTYEGNDYANINRQNIRNYNLVYDWNRYFKKFNYLLHTGLTHQDMIYYLNNFISGYGYFNAVYSESAVNGFFNNVKMSWNPMKILVFDSKLSIDYHSVSTLDTVTGLGYIADRLENS
ncbi:MAG: TonB-dependent receptor plug domain-containing protein, partial [Bacteroidia bacterium]|nr:TonB-dependent receptor plug domain-containing protein [Bacteroidia bacterium]